MKPLGDGGAPTSDDEFAALASAPRLSTFDDVAAAPGPTRSERAER